MSAVLNGCLALCLVAKVYLHRLYFQNLDSVHIVNCIHKILSIAATLFTKFYILFNMKYELAIRLKCGYLAPPTV